MTLSVSSNGCQPPQKLDCGSRPYDTPNKPHDNTAAAQSPKETSAAVKSSFGDLPQPPYDAPKRFGDEPRSKGGHGCCCPGKGRSDANPASDAKPPAEGSTSTGGELPPVAPTEAGNSAGESASAPPDPAANDTPYQSNKTVEPPAAALKNFPQGTERGDPAKIKDQLFDGNGNLDTTKLYDAAAKYDPRDVYNALIHGSKYGGWDALVNNGLNLNPEHQAVQPSADKAKEALVAVATWQDMNGKYAPIKNGAVPPIVFYSGPFTDRVGGYTQGGDIYVNNGMDKNTPGGLTNTIYHELNHAQMADAFGDVYLPDGKISLELETITEFLVNEWSGAVKNSGYEQKYPDSFKKIEDAVQKLGNGDRDAGVELLRRAYYTGDPDAIAKLREYLPPTMGILPNL